jgi:hypothetical protein
MNIAQENLTPKFRYFCYDSWDTFIAIIPRLTFMSTIRFRNSENAPPKVEKITPHLTREWRDSNLVTLIMTQVHRDDVDAYIRTLRENLDNWQSGILYGVYDISAPGNSLTPYFRERLNEFADYSKTTSKQTCSAIVVPNTLMSRIFGLFADLFARRTGREIITQKIFTNKDAAWRWIEDQRRING